MSGPFGSSQFMYATGAAEEGQSLRFEDGDSAYLTFTPASAGNRKTWTWSGWVKRGNLGTRQAIFVTSNSAGNDYIGVEFQTGNTLVVHGNNGSASVQVLLTSNAVFRDTSAWYHIVISFDTTQATSTNRVKVYVNGVLQTFSSATYPPLNYDSRVNTTNQHNLGSFLPAAGVYVDGYLANVTFIDGTALDPTSFGEYEDTLWKPKSDTDIQALTFGTNGFYLPFKQTTEAEGFSTVTYTGSGTTHSIEGVGFSSSPDLVWIKDRTTGSSHRLHDSIRGAGIKLSTDTTAAEVDESSSFTSFDADGFSLAGSAGAYNTSGRNYVAWCWDAGSGSAVSNTDGSITSTVKANTAKGFSIVSYTGNATSGATVGHGLSQKPDILFFKNRDDGTRNWVVYSDITGTNGFLILNSTAAFSDVSSVVPSPTSSVFYLHTFDTNNGNGDNHICYAFHSVSGYSSIGSYSGTGGASPAVTVTTGFKPAFVMIKRTDSTGDWYMLDNTRFVADDNNNVFLEADTSDAEGTASTNNIDFTSTGFVIDSTGSAFNASGGSYIYLAFADTRDATFFGDTSGNGNNWTPNKLNNTDVVPDSPVSGGNFATLNPLDSYSSAHTFSEGNLRCTHNSGTWRNARTGMRLTSGQWYWETVFESVSGAGGFMYGIGNELLTTSANPNTNYSVNYNGITSGTIIQDGTTVNTGTAYTAGDVMGLALDIDAGTVKFYKNNTLVYTVTSITGTEFYPIISASATGSTHSIVNFGQDSSFAGNETPQGNTDDNGVGDFYYAPPSGFLALTTGNLPTPTITAPDEYFNTVLYSGNSSTQSITGVNFQPDWTWIKSRSDVNSHQLYDSVRGATKRLKFDSTNAEDTKTDGLTSFDSDGFSLGLLGGSNGSGKTYAAWNWLAGNGTVSNTDGSITSTVSANTDAGFSIVNYAADGTTTSTVGHGLSSAPEIVIHKNRDGVSSWLVNTTAVDGSNDYLFLNTTAAKANWSAASPTSSVFTSWNAPNGNEVIAFCFHSVPQYSKCGVYTGNGSSDGTFVHCGFRPAWIMVKRTDNTGNWWIHDAKRNTYNVVDNYLFANSSNAEASYDNLDILSNGFKLRLATYQPNTSGGSFIFLAFAEAPFSKSNAR